MGFGQSLILCGPRILDTFLFLYKALVFDSKMTKFEFKKTSKIVAYFNSSVKSSTSSNIDALDPFHG